MGLTEFIVILVVVSTAGRIAIAGIKAGMRSADRRLELEKARLASQESGEDAEQLRGEVEALRAHLVALEERQDFTERVLTRVKDRGRLKSPEQGQV